MIIIDTALAKRHDESNPVKVALVGAGYMGRGIALQILSAVPGMQLVAISNRTVSEAERAYRQAGADSCVNVSSVSELESAIHKKQYAVTDDPMLLCEAEGIDAIIESTGVVELGAAVSLRAIEYGKHIILMNAEVDATVGPILKTYADKAGVVYTNADGDQPGVIMNLYRYVKAIGCNPVMAGNIKGLQDPYRTPETQKSYADKYHQKPTMVTSFADGTKISMEMAVVANATGFRVGKRGMYGFECKHVNETLDLYPTDELLNGGLVDYILGAEPAAGIFIIGHHENLIQRQYLNYYKMGDGPLYVFYNPYHICHFEVPLTAARAVLFNDAAVTPIGAPVVDVITAAKRDLKKGETLDGIGGFTVYGVAENHDITKRENLIPMGLAEGCRIKRDIKQDEILSYDDVEIPDGRLIDRLRKEQNDYF